MKDSLLIKAARCEEVPRVPVWFMRQAGRYLKEYRSLRSKYSFLTMCRTPEIAAEVTLQPVRILGVDAAIVFSDILVVPQAMGMKLEYIDKRGPVFFEPICDERGIQKLYVDGVWENLDFVCEAIQIAKVDLDKLKVPIIGFAGAPFTVASYMIQGSSTDSFRKMKKFLRESPGLAKRLLDKIAAATVDHLSAQIQAGADVIMIFDTWADILSLEDFKRYSFDYLTQIIRGLNNPQNVPVIFFCKGSSNYAHIIQEAGVNVIGLDSNCEMADMRRKIKPSVALQGNLDPNMLYADKNVLRKSVCSLINSIRDQKGFIFNLGHGIMPDVNQDAVKCVVDTLKEQYQ